MDQTPTQAFFASLRRSAALDVGLVPFLVVSSLFVPAPLRVVAWVAAAFCLLVTLAEAVAAREAVLRRQRFAEESR